MVRSYFTCVHVHVNVYEYWFLKDCVSPLDCAVHVCVECCCLGLEPVLHVLTHTMYSTCRPAWNRCCNSYCVCVIILFNHRGCLRSWLEQDTVCPTCRRSLSQDLTGGQGQGAETAEGGRGQGRRRNARNWLLHFNGASIASWLPTFSLELHQEDTLINDTATLHREVSSCN